MVTELDYETALTVIESWDVLRRKRNYAETMGCGIFVKFFKIDPGAARSMFGFGDQKKDCSAEYTGNSVFKNKKFLDIAKNFVDLIDQAVDMLGPDLETVTEMFVELGKTHKRDYNLEPKFYPVLGRALLEQLEDMLGPEVFTLRTKACWKQVYQALAMDMASATITDRRELLRRCRALSL